MGGGGDTATWTSTASVEIGGASCTYGMSLVEVVQVKCGVWFGFRCRVFL